MLPLRAEPWFPQFSQTQALSVWKESYICNPTLVSYSQGSEVVRKHDKGTMVPEKDGKPTSSGLTVDASKQQTACSQTKAIIVEELSSENIPLEASLSLTGSDSVLNVDELVHAKRQDLRDLSLKKGLCSIELEFLTKLSKAKSRK